MQDQDEAEEMLGESKSVRFKEEIKEDAAIRIEKNTIISKNTIYMGDYQTISQKNTLLPLNQMNVSR